MLDDVFTRPALPWVYDTDVEPPEMPDEAFVCCVPGCEEITGPYRCFCAAHGDEDDNRKEDQ